MGLVDRFIDWIIQGLIGFLMEVQSKTVRELLILNQPADYAGAQAGFEHNLVLFPILLSIAFLLGLATYPIAEEDITFDLFMLKIIKVIFFIATIWVIIWGAVELSNILIKWVWVDPDALNPIIVDFNRSMAGLGAGLVFAVLVILLATVSIVLYVIFFFALYLRQWLTIATVILAPLLAPGMALDFGPFKSASKLPYMMFRMTAYLILAGVIAAAFIQVGVAIAGGLTDADHMGDDELANDFMDLENAEDAGFNTDVDPSLYAETLEEGTPTEVRRTLTRGYEPGDIDPQNTPGLAGEVDEEYENALFDGEQAESAYQGDLAERLEAQYGEDAENLEITLNRSALADISKAHYASPDAAIDAEPDEANRAENACQTGLRIAESGGEGYGLYDYPNEAAFITNEINAVLDQKVHSENEIAVVRRWALGNATYNGEPVGEPSVDNMDKGCVLPFIEALNNRESLYKRAEVFQISIQRAVDECVGEEYNYGEHSYMTPIASGGGDTPLFESNFKVEASEGSPVGPNAVELDRDGFLEEHRDCVEDLNEDVSDAEVTRDHLWMDKMLIEVRKTPDDEDEKGIIEGGADWVLDKGGDLWGGVVSFTRGAGKTVGATQAYDGITAIKSLLEDLTTSKYTMSGNDLRNGCDIGDDEDYGEVVCYDTNVMDTFDKFLLWFMSMIAPVLVIFSSMYAALTPAMLMSRLSGGGFTGGAAAGTAASQASNASSSLGGSGSGSTPALGGGGGPGPDGGGTQTDPVAATETADLDGDHIANPAESVIQPGSEDESTEQVLESMDTSAIEEPEPSPTEKALDTTTSVAKGAGSRAKSAGSYFTHGGLSDSPAAFAKNGLSHLKNNPPGDSPIESAEPTAAEKLDEVDDYSELEDANAAQIQNAEERKVANLDGENWTAVVTNEEEGKGALVRQHGEGGAEEAVPFQTEGEGVELENGHVYDVDGVVVEDGDHSFVDGDNNAITITKNSSVEEITGEDGPPLNTGESDGFPRAVDPVDFDDIPGGESDE